jgi:hypothetical protein
MRLHLPQDQVLELLVKAHAKDPATFDWTKAEVIAAECIQEISVGELVNDEELIARHGRDQKDQKNRYKNMFKQCEPILQPAFEANGEARPRTFRDFLDFQEKSEGKLMAGLCKGLYDRVAGTNISAEFFLDFLAACPPFRAFNYAMHMSNFDGAVRHKEGERFKSGFKDLFMSLYLPYCELRHKHTDLGTVPVSGSKNT